MSTAFVFLLVDPASNGILHDAHDVIIHAEDRTEASLLAFARQKRDFSRYWLRFAGTHRNGRYYFDLPFDELPPWARDRAEETAEYEAKRAARLAKRSAA